MGVAKQCLEGHTALSSLESVVVDSLICLAGYAAAGIKKCLTVNELSVLLQSAAPEFNEAQCFHITARQVFSQTTPVVAVLDSLSNCRLWHYI